MNSDQRSVRVRADFSRPAVVLPQDREWVASPVPGVSRMMLDRVGGEVARATSLVRYAPNSEFPEHEHGGGEEILVLRGEFADDQGRYPAGAYLRNPVGTRHAPKVGPRGAEIFVKLHQFDPADRRHFSLDTHRPAWLPGRVPGLEVMPLHRFGPERVRLERWPPALRLAPRTVVHGAELLVLEGSIRDSGIRCPEGSWLRLPPGAVFEGRAGAEGARIYLKTGHLGHAEPR